jgi:hypothetical protein
MSDLQSPLPTPLRASLARLDPQAAGADFHGCNGTAFKHIIKHIIAISRRITPEVCSKLSPFEDRGRGECRVPNAPAAWCALG